MGDCGDQSLAEDRKNGFRTLGTVSGTVLEKPSGDAPAADPARYAKTRCVLGSVVGAPPFGAIWRHLDVLVLFLRGSRVFEEKRGFPE